MNRVFFYIIQMFAFLHMAHLGEQQTPECSRDEG